MAGPADENFQRKRLEMAQVWASVHAVEVERVEMMLADVAFVERHAFAPVVQAIFVCLSAVVSSALSQQGDQYRGHSPLERH